MGVAAVLAEADRRTVGQVWGFRARLEQSAVDRFARMGGELESVGAGADVVALARRAVADEQRHAVVCADIAGQYGCAPGQSSLSSGPVPQQITPHGMSLRDRVLYETVAFCCLTETINAALMTETFRTATAAPIRGAVRTILQDEVWHSRLGWAHLSAERAQGRGEFLGALLPRMLRGTVQEELFLTSAEEAESDALLQHGELPLATRRRLFESTLRDVIFPGLELLQVSTVEGRSWLDGISVTRSEPSERQSPP